MKKIIAPICMGIVMVSQTFAQAQAPANQLAAAPVGAAARPARVLSRDQQNAQIALKNAIDVDYEDMLGKLKITEPLRKGPSGATANYDESIANPYPLLPRPLVFNDGTPVKTPADWRKRRDQIKQDFDREIYGRVPKKTPKVKWVIDSAVNEKIGGIAVNTKYLTGKVDNSAYPAIEVNIKMSLSVPVNAAKAVPVIMQYGSVGNRGIAQNVPGNRAANSQKSWKEQVLEKGWACALLDPNSIQADNGAGLTQGIIGLVNKGHFRKPEDWGSLRAIAWGADRALDYLETNPAVNAKQVAIEGHSRWGKAALVTLAYNERMATAYVSSSGAGGAKLHRRNTGELVENVAGSSEYHWMAGNYLKFAGPLTADDLSVDSHELIALCAPRPVFISSGTSGIAGSGGDSWVDAPGMFMAADAAGPVYTLLGKKAISQHTFPKIETLLDGDVAFRQHAGGHTDTPNWPYFLAFADKYFK
jgi:hypothetical protein